MTIGLIYAVSQNDIMGHENRLPWPSIPEDLEHFRRTTYGSAVVMGRKTWESLPASERPLRGRRNIVLTKNPDYHAQGAEIITHPVELFEVLGDDLHQPVWVIGGPKLLKYYEPWAFRLIITTVELEVEGDTLAPRIEMTRWHPKKIRHYRAKSGIPFTITEYLRKPLSELRDAV